MWYESKKAHLYSQLEMKSLLHSLFVFGKVIDRLFCYDSEQIFVSRIYLVF